MVDRVERSEPARWGLAVYAAVHCLLNAVILFWLLWRVVPMRAGMLEGIGLPLTFASRMVIGGANWFIRLVPFAIVLAAFGFPLIGGAVVLWRLRRKPVSARSLLRVAIPVLLGLALAGTLVNAFCVWAVDTPLHRFIESREHRPVANPSPR